MKKRREKRREGAQKSEFMGRTASEKHMLMASAPAVASSNREAFDIFMPVCVRESEERVCVREWVCVRVGVYACSHCAESSRR